LAAFVTEVNVMIRLRWVNVLLLLMLLLSGCAAGPSEKATVANSMVKEIPAELPLEWHQTAGKLLDSAWVSGPEEAGFAEPPDVQLGQVTKDKLYASAWTAALLGQANETVSSDILALLHPWLDQLVQQEFNFPGGYPRLHNLYLYHQIQTSLDQPVDNSLLDNEMKQLLVNKEAKYVGHVTAKGDLTEDGWNDLDGEVGIQTINDDRIMKVKKFRILKVAMFRKATVLE